MGINTRLQPKTGNTVSIIPIRRLSTSQRGMAAIIVTTVLIAVTGLIIMGFSLTVRRNQRETLDQQLSAQAYYAAESGVNYARKVAADAMATTNLVPERTTCTGGTDYNTPPDLDATADDIKITCLMVTSSLPSLAYTGINTGKGVVAPVIAANGTDWIRTIELSWAYQAPPTGNLAGCQGAAASLPVPGSWSCLYGLLRADITSDFSGANLATTAFFVPRNGSETPITYPTSGKVNATCNATRCHATINNLNAHAYYLRLNSIYKSIPSLTVVARDGGGNVINLSGQIQIDSTGKAQDVLRRIQVRIPAAGFADAPMFALQTTDSICKKFDIAPPANGYPGYYDDVTCTTP